MKWDEMRKHPHHLGQQSLRPHDGGAGDGRRPVANRWTDVGLALRPGDLRAGPGGGARPTHLTGERLLQGETLSTDPSPRSPGVRLVRLSIRLSIRPSMAAQTLSSDVQAAARKWKNVGASALSSFQAVCALGFSHRLRKASLVRAQGGGAQFLSVCPPPSLHARHAGDAPDTPLQPPQSPRAPHAHGAQGCGPRAPDPRISKTILETWSLHFGNLVSLFLRPSSADQGGSEPRLAGRLSRCQMRVDSLSLLGQGHTGARMCAPAGAPRALESTPAALKH